MERRELRHDRQTVSLLTDQMVFLLKYRGKIPVEKTIALAVEGIIRKICEEMKIEIIDIAVKNREKPNAKTLCTGLGLKSGV
jgi:REP element-mobilizing transposase RayT